MQHLPDYIAFKSYSGQPLSEIFIAANDDLLELMGKLLAMDPLKRCTATQVPCFPIPTMSQRNVREKMGFLCHAGL